MAVFRQGKVMIAIRFKGKGDNSMRNCKDQTLEVLSIKDKSVARIQQIHYFIYYPTDIKQ